MVNSDLSIIRTSAKCALIGSRKIPDRIRKRQIYYGRKLSESGILGYSGGADGSDTAFLANYNPELIRIILPHNGFNKLYCNGKTIFDGHQLDHNKCDLELNRIGFHEDDLYELPEYIYKFFSRNTAQIRTETQSDLVDFVLYYAPEKNSLVSGGTRIAVYLARTYGIPCFNMYYPDMLASLDSFFDYPVPNTLDI
ncbi:DprA-like DNA recombination-mediator protein [Morganella phage vB_Mm5]